MRVVCVCVLLLLAAPALGQDWTDTDESVTTKAGSINLDHANLKCWLSPEAVDAQSQADGWRATSWPGSASDACTTTATGSARPTYKKHIINGKGVMRFGAAAEKFTLGDTTYLGAYAGAATGLAWSYCAVVRATGAGTVWSVGGAGTLSSLDITGSAGSFKFAGYSGGNTAAETNPRADRFHIVCGLSNGKQYIDGTTTAAPADNSGNPAFSITVPATTLDKASPSIGGSFTGDIAEYVMYNAALNLWEVDRVGHYLARKYSLPWHILPRTAARGYWGSVTGDGVLANKATHEMTITPIGAVGEGNTVLTISGRHIVPLDADPDGTAITGADINRIQMYLKVTIGSLARECADPTATEPCVTNDRAETECTNAQIWYANGNTFDQSQSQNIQCRLPAHSGKGQDVIIRWHGIPTVLKNWFHYSAPKVDSVWPTTASYTGGAWVSVNGKNFGTKDTWTTYTSGNKKTTMTENAGVDIEARSPVSCSAVTYVSDTQLVCQVPALPSVLQTVDKTARQVSTQVHVTSRGGRSVDSSSSSWAYSDVPAFYSCDNSDVTSTGKNTCFTCCRHECVVEEFALGGARGGHTYAHCDRECYRFCGYI